MTPAATSSPPPMDAALAEFICGGQSMHLAAVNERGQATVVRTLGCRVNKARTRVTVLLPRSQSAQLLVAIEANRRVAAVFSQPETNKSIQLKGQDAVVAPATAQDRALLTRYVQDISERLKALHIPEIFVHALCSCAAEDLLAITFSPQLAYQQTPGGSAGDSLPIGGPLP